MLAIRESRISVQLDHAIVPSRDRKSAAWLLATILGVPWAESGVGPFCPVYGDEKDRKTHEEMGFHDGWGKAFDQLVAVVRKILGWRNELEPRVGPAWCMKLHF